MQTPESSQVINRRRFLELATLAVAGLALLPSCDVIDLSVEREMDIELGGAFMIVSEEGRELIRDNIESSNIDSVRMYRITYGVPLLNRRTIEIRIFYSSANEIMNSDQVAQLFAFTRLLCLEHDLIIDPIKETNIFVADFRENHFSFTARRVLTGEDKCDSYVDLSNEDWGFDPFVWEVINSWFLAAAPSIRELVLGNDYNLSGRAEFEGIAGSISLGYQACKEGLDYRSYTERFEDMTDDGGLYLFSFQDGEANIPFELTLLSEEEYNSLQQIVDLK